MTLQLHQPDGEGGLTPHTEPPGEWRTQLRSPRWRVAPLANREMNPTRTSVSILFWLALGVLTFVLLIAGYGSGFWK